jgi:gliding motility-associated-like protein
MNNFLKANPLILSFLVIISLGLGNSASAQITASDVAICEGESATLSVTGACPACVIEWHSTLPVAPGSLLGTGSTFTYGPLNSTTTIFARETIIGIPTGNNDGATITVNPNPGPLAFTASEFQCLTEPFVATLAGNQPAGILVEINYHDGPFLTDPILQTDIVPIDSSTAWLIGAHPFTAEGYYVISMSAVNPGTGCQSTPTSKIVNMVDEPAAPAVSGNTALCSGESTTLDAPGAGGTITWYSDAGLTTTVGSGSQYTTPALGTGITSYWVTESDPRPDEGCESPATQVDITVSASPVDPVVTPDEVCAGESASLEATGSGGTLNWYNDAAGSVLVGTGSPFVTPALVTTTTYYVQEDDGTCTSNLVPVTATVNQLPTPPEVEDAFVACEFESEVTIEFLVNDEQLGYLFNVTAIEVFSGDTVVNLTDLGPIVDIGTQVVAMGPVTLFPLGDHYIITTMTDPVTGCTSIPDISILTVAEGPVAPLVLDTVEICEGETATIFAFGDFDSTSYVSWYDEPSFDPIAFGWEYETQPLSFDQTFYATVTNEAGCEGPVAAVTVVVNPAPAAPAGTDATVCEGESATLTVAGGGGTYTWFSDGAGTDPLATGDTYFTPALAQTTVFYVNETDLNGCSSATVGVTAFVTPAPAIPQAVGTTLCIGESGEISATGSGSGSLTWYNDALIPLETDVMPPAEQTLAVGPFAAAGTYFFYVSESDGLCESELAEVTVVVGDTPEPPVAEGAIICAGESATLTATGTGGDLNWYSDFDQTNLVGIGPSYETGPLFTTTSFWVTESFGSCESTSTEVEVTVNDNPATPSFTSNAPLCEGEDLELMTDFVPGATYQWTGPAGFSSNELNPTIAGVTQAANQGVYSLTITDAGTGCTSGEASEFIEIYATPDAPSLTSNSPICAGETVILIASEVQDAEGYTWYDGDNNEIGSTEGNIFEVEGVTESSLFGVSISVNGCESPVATTWIVVSPTPDAVNITVNSPLCEGDDLILEADDVDGATYVWSGPNGPIDESGPTVVIEEAGPGDAGTYSVFIIVDGCPSEASEVEVEVLAAPVLPQNPTSNSPVCEHDTLYLIGPDLDGVTYQWTGPNGFLSNEQSPVIYDVLEDDHQGFYTLVVTDETTGCESIVDYTLLVLVNKFPDNVNADNDGPKCQGETLTLAATSIFNAEYTWTGPLNFDVTTTEPYVTIDNVQPEMSGTYTVLIQLGSCASMQVSTDVVIYANPIADAGDDLQIEEGMVFQLDGTGSINAVDFFWEVSHPSVPVNGSVFDDPTRPNPIIGQNGPLEASDDPYTFTLTVYNENGCTDMDIVLVYVYETQNLIIPNVITPNGDGINDFWVITYLDNLSNYTLSVYARGGTLIFRTDSYNNDWDGTMDGDDLPEGTYWYTIHHDGGDVFKGFIEILR